jgi:hypothetical protein
MPIMTALSANNPATAGLALPPDVVGILLDMRRGPGTLEATGRA